MLFDDFWLFRNQPLSANREAAEAFAFFDARLLQQGQTAAACADEDELRGVGKCLFGFEVFDCNCPQLTCLSDVSDAVASGVATALLIT